MRPYLFIIFIVITCSCNDPEGASKNVFRYNESTGIATLDPAFAKNQSIIWPVHQLYNTLVEPDQEGNIKPSLARSWSISEDNTEYTFLLRGDVFFHDNACFPGGKGRLMKASDVVYSLSRIIDAKLASPGAWIFNGIVHETSPFYAPNDSTFVLRLIRPYAQILQVLTMQYCSVVAPEAVEQYGNQFRRNPCGTGPFQFMSWEEGLALVFKKNPNYFETDSAGIQLPYLERIKISFSDSKATEFLLFRQKQLDFINDIDASFKDEVLSLKGNLRDEWQGKLVLQTHPYLNTEYFGILVDSSNELMEGSPLRSRKVRQAMNYAIDRRKMILYLRNSLSNPAESGFIPQGMPGFDSSVVKGYHYDPGKARQLLSEAGFPGGEGLQEIKLYTIPIYSEIANYLVSQMQQVGIRVKVEVVLRSFLFELTSNSRAPFFRGNWLADYSDGLNYLSVFYSKNPAPPNYTRYSNPKFDEIFERAMTETNDSIRLSLYRQADQIAIADAPLIPLWYDRVIRLVQPNITGFEPNNLNILEVRKTRKI